MPSKAERGQSMLADVGYIAMDRLLTGRSPGEYSIDFFHFRGTRFGPVVEYAFHMFIITHHGR